MAPRPLLLIVLLASALCPPALSLRFDLESGHTKCILEDIMFNAMSVGKFTVVPSSSVPSHDGHQDEPQQPLPESHKITARVTSPHGSSLHLSEKVGSGNFAFTAPESGDYITCFTAPDHKPAEKITIDFEWRTGIAARNWPTVAKKGQVDVMKHELTILEETIKSIHDEMLLLREREEQMQELNRSTNSRMAWLSFLSLGLCVSVAGLQLWHLKTFFEKKKLI